jgi:hypothetical protein
LVGQNVSELAAKLFTCLGLRDEIDPDRSARPQHRHSRW